MRDNEFDRRFADHEQPLLAFLVYERVTARSGGPRSMLAHA